MFVVSVNQVKNFNKINVVNLSNEEKAEFDRNTYIVQKHKLVYQNQKQNFETIKDKLEERSCILILDFKENFKLSYGGNEISYDFNNKRQASCFGGSLIFNYNNISTTHYIAYLSEILNHDYLFSGDCFELIMNELK